MTFMAAAPGDRTGPFLPEAAEKRLLLKFLPFRQDAPIYLPPEIRPSGESVYVKRITLTLYTITRSPFRLFRNNN